MTTALLETVTKKRKTARPQLAGIRDRIVGVETKVPTLDGQMVPYVNFDNAASTPVLREVLDVVNEFMPWYSSVHRGSGFKSQLATEAYEDARHIVGRFFGADSREHVVVFGKNSTEALNKLSYRLGLNKDDVVLVSLLEHHSNDLPWRKQAVVKRIKTDKFGRLDEADFDQKLKRYRGRIKLVAVTGGSNVTGHVPAIHRLAAKAHAAGAQILVDCAQLAPHRAVDIGRLDDPEHLDYIVISAHKMYAPFGTGALIGRRDTFEKGTPELCGGGTIDLVTTQQVKWTSPPDRDEAGSPNVVGAVALAAGLISLRQIGMAQIAAHEAELTAYALRQLGQLKEIKIYGDNDPAAAHQRLGVIPFRVEGLSHSLVASILGTEFGIGVRSGCFCAHPYVTSLLDMNKADIKRFGKAVTNGDKRAMPGFVRVSFGMYNTMSEVDKLVEALKVIIAGKYRGHYLQDKPTGEFRAVGHQPDLKKYFKL